MRKRLTILTTLVSVFVLSGQVRNKLNTRHGVVNQLRDYGYVSYKGLDYFPAGKDSLVVKNSWNKLDTIYLPSSLTIDKRKYIVSGFKEWGFRNCTELKYISIPEHITEIAGACFDGCHNLRTCIMPGIKKIGGYAFFRTKLSHVKFPEGLESIGDYAFCECSELRNVELPSTLKYIGDCALSNNYLDTVKVNFTKPIPIHTNAFWLKRNNSSIRKITLVVPKGCYNSFKEDKEWRYFSIIER